MIDALRDICKSSRFMQDSYRHFLGMVPIPIRYGRTFRYTYAFVAKVAVMEQRSVGVISVSTITWITAKAVK